MATLNLSVSGEEGSQLEQDGSPLASLDKKKWHLTYGWWLTSAAAEDRSTGIFWGGWYLDVEKPICRLPLLPILLNCVRSHVDLYCVRSVRASSSSDR